jgi:hypothetical protein
MHTHTYKYAHLTHIHALCLHVYSFSIQFTPQALLAPLSTRRCAVPVVLHLPGDVRDAQPYARAGVCGGQRVIMKQREARP